MADAAAPADAGMPVPDAAQPPDAAQAPDAAQPPDAAVPPPADAGEPPDAAVPPPEDAGEPPVDAGDPPPTDAGEPPDAAVPVDAGTGPVDAGRRDSGSIPDAAGPVDANVPCVEGCVGQSTAVMCINGRRVERRCAADEYCEGNVCILREVGDAGPGCRPGCASSTTVRRCSTDASVLLACDPFEVCEVGVCIPVGDAGYEPPPLAECTTKCLSKTKLQACTSRGEVVEVTCNEGDECKKNQCESPPGPVDSCSCTGLSSLTLPVMGVLLMRRRRQPHARA